MYYVVSKRYTLYSIERYLISSIYTVVYYIRSPCFSRCEAQQSAANSKNENLEYDKEQLGQKKERAENKKAELEAEVEATEAEMADIEKAMQDAKDTRIKETEAFKKALKDDADAVTPHLALVSSLRKLHEDA